MVRHGTVLLCAFGASLLAHSAAAAPKRWHTEVVRVVVDASMESPGLAGTTAALFAGAAWANASDKIPELILEPGHAGPIGYIKDAKNENSIRYAAEGAPQAKGTLAVTVATYNLKTGALLDADIVVNGEHKFRKLTGPAEKNKNAPVAYDLQNTLTHELGHFMGLTEDYDHPHATMYAYTQPGEVKKRVPGPEDLERLYTLYETDPDAEAGTSGCALARGGLGGAGVFWLMGLSLLARLGRRRRKHGRGRASLALVGGLVLCAAPSWADAPIRSGGFVYQAELRVEFVSSRMEGGLIVTEMSLAAEECNGECRELPESVAVYGGEHGEIGQIVGHVPTPVQGDRVVARVTETEMERKLELAPISTVGARTARKEGE